MDTAKELGETTLFAGLESEDLGNCAGIATETTFGPEEAVYETGSAGDSMFVIVEGEFVVRVTDEHEEEVDVATLKPGSYFGEMEVVGGINRTASIVSTGDGRCYQFDASTLLGLLKRHDHLAAHFYREICKGLVQRLTNTTRDLGYFKARAT